jgi:hypothetical protein
MSQRLRAQANVAGIDAARRFGHDVEVDLPQHYLPIFRSPVHPPPFTGLFAAQIQPNSATKLNRAAP